MKGEVQIVTARKWGHSIGVALPPGVVSKEKIRPEDKVMITVKKVSSISELFGTHRFKKSTQEIKDELRQGWE